MKLFNLPCPIVIAALMSFLVLASCSTANFIVSEWRNPAYVAPIFKTVMVGGLSEQNSVQRNFEDEFLTQLKRADSRVCPYIDDSLKSN